MAKLESISRSPVKRLHKLEVRVVVSINLGEDAVLASPAQAVVSPFGGGFGVSEGRLSARS